VNTLALSSTTFGRWSVSRGELVQGLEAGGRGSRRFGWTGGPGEQAREHFRFFTRRFYQEVSHARWAAQVVFQHPPGALSSRSGRDGQHAPRRAALEARICGRQPWAALDIAAGNDPVLEAWPGRRRHRRGVIDRFEPLGSGPRSALASRGSGSRRAGDQREGCARAILGRKR